MQIFQSSLSTSNFVDAYRMYTGNIARAESLEWTGIELEKVSCTRLFLNRSELQVRVLLGKFSRDDQNLLELRAFQLLMPAYNTVLHMNHCRRDWLRSSPTIDNSVPIQESTFQSAAAQGPYLGPDQH